MRRYRGIQVICPSHNSYWEMHSTLLCAEVAIKRMVVLSGSDDLPCIGYVHADEVLS